MGCIRTKAYVEWLRDGKMHAGRTLEVVLDSGALAVVDGQMGRWADGQMGTGQWIGRQTMELAIGKCRGVCAVHRLRKKLSTGR